jgi:hypothetical protein
MSQTITRTIRLSPADNVVVARAALRADTRVEEEGLTTIEVNMFIRTILEWMTLIGIIGLANRSESLTS